MEPSGASWTVFLRFYGVNKEGRRNSDALGEDF